MLLNLKDDLILFTPTFSICVWLSSSAVSSSSSDWVSASVVLPDEMLPPNNLKEPLKIPWAFSLPSYGELHICGTSPPYCKTIPAVAPIPPAFPLKVPQSLGLTSQGRWYDSPAYRAEPSPSSPKNGCAILSRL